MLIDMLTDPKTEDVRVCQVGISKLSGSE